MPMLRKCLNSKGIDSLPAGVTEMQLRELVDKLLEEWRRMFVKRYNKIFAIDSTNPHAIVELKKRLLQNAALCIALLAILHFKRPVDIVNDKIPSNLKAYTSHTGDDNG